MVRLLPKAPSNQELDRDIPPIAPVPVGQSRPFWSVMIPTYNRDHYLREALESVLMQDPGPTHMQIEVVDDKSTTGDPAAVVYQLGKGRVEFHRRPSNQGSTRIFNTCVQRSRGEWIHMLHSDDKVLPEFYQACERAIDAFPNAVMVFSQVEFINQHGQPSSIVNSDPEPEPFVVKDFLQQLTVDQQCQFAGVAVRRSAFEKVGGFCLRFDHVPDWDMWFRIGLIGDVVHLPRSYAQFRIHSGSVTSQLKASGATIRETIELKLVNFTRLPSNQLACLAEHIGKWKACLAERAELAAWEFDRNGNFEARLNQMHWACKLRPTPRRLFIYAKSWLKARLRARNAIQP